MRVIVSFLLSVFAMLAVASDRLEVVVDAAASTFSVPLPANPTTGFRWLLHTYDKQHFKVSGEEYRALSPKRIGSGGETIFTFEKKSALKSLEKTEITFNYQRPWELKRDHIMHVTVVFKKHAMILENK